MVKLKLIKIAQLNAARKRRALLDLLNEKDQKGRHLYDLLLITEPPVNPGKKSLFIPSNDYKAYYVMEELKKSYSVYSAIYVINKNLIWRPVTEVSNANYAEIEISVGNSAFKVGSIYCHGDTPFNEKYKEFTDVIFASDCKKIIGGDFNAHHDDWEDRGLTNESGKFFKQQFEKHDWTVCNEKGHFTLRPRNNGQPSVIDLTVANEIAYSYVKNWNVTDNSYGSDHLCIQFEINEKSTMGPINQIGIPSKKVARDVLHTIRNNKGTILTYETLRLLYQQSRLKLGNQLPKLVPGTTFSNNKKLNLIRTKLNKINRVLKQYSEVPHSKGFDSLQTHEEEVRSLSLELKIERCKLIKLKEEEVGILKARALKKKIKLKGEAAIWKELNIDIKSSHGINILSDDEGNIITNHKEIIISIMKKLARKQTKKTGEILFPQKHFHDHTLKNIEIDRAIVTLNAAKAKGEDEVGASLIKEIYDLDKNCIQQIIKGWWDQTSTPKCLKQTRLALISKSNEAIKKLDSFRPIGIGNHLLVLYERILNERLYFFVNRNLLVEEQLGYRKGLSLVESFSPFIKFVIEANNSGHKVIVWKADVEAAFDRVDTNSILNVLSEHIPNKLWLAIKDLLTDRTVIYKSTDPEYKVIFPKFNGTTQGSVLSPTLFAAIMGVLHKEFKAKLRINNFKNGTFIGPYSFADDIFGAFSLSPKLTPKERIVEASCVLSFIEKTLNTTLATWNLNLASNKSECIITNTFHTQKYIEAISKNCNFSLKQKIKILGLVIGNKKKSLFGHHVEEKCSEVKKLLEDFRKNTWRYNFDIRKIIVHRTLIPKLFYLGELWAGQINEQQVIQLGQVIRLLSIYVIGGAATISHVAATSLAKIPPIAIWLEELITFESISSHGIFYEGSILNVQKKCTVADFFHPACIPQPHKIQLHYTHEELIEVEGENDLHIYTDASLNNTNGGMAIIAPKTKKTVLLKTHKLTNVHELEIKAIHIALLMAEELFEGDKKLLKKIIILSDSTSSLTQIQNISSTNPTVLQIRKCLQYHNNWKRTIQMIWVKGHSGVYGNELADTLAGIATSKGHPYILDIPVSVMKQHLAKEMRKKWEQWYKTNVSASTHLSKFFGVDDFPPDLDLKPNHSLTALFTSHSLRYNDYKYRFYKRTDGTCPCDGKTPQTGHHAITECTILKEARAEAYLTLGIETDLYERKCLNNIKKDVQFIKFTSYIARRIGEFWN